MVIPSRGPPDPQAREPPSSTARLSPAA